MFIGVDEEVAMPLFDSPENRVARAARCTAPHAVSFRLSAT